MTCLGRNLNFRFLRIWRKILWIWRIWNPGLPTRGCLLSYGRGASPWCGKIMKHEMKESCLRSSETTRKNLRVNYATQKFQSSWHIEFLISGILALIAGLTKINGELLSVILSWFYLAVCFIVIPLVMIYMIKLDYKEVENSKVIIMAEPLVDGI